MFQLDLTWLARLAKGQFYKNIKKISKTKIDNTSIKSLQQNNLDTKNNIKARNFFLKKKEKNAKVKANQPSTDYTLLLLLFVFAI